jgi:hypothetical protein
MTIRTDADLERRAETHLATITATGNFILFHARHRKLGTSDQKGDDLFWWLNPNRGQSQESQMEFGLGVNAGY